MDERCAEMTCEQALILDCDGDELVAVISATTEKAELGVLVIVGGPQYRVGSHRQFVLLARQLSAAGVPAMRFDQRGTGDSCGAIRGFETITADIETAINVFTRMCPSIRGVVLWGLCDAASAALLYWRATADARVIGMVLLNPWVRSDETLARAHVRHYYPARLLQREFWQKLTRGRIDIIESIRTFGRTLKTSRHRGRTQSHDLATFQGRMAAALHGFEGPLLIILSGNDLTGKEFVEYCRSQPDCEGIFERSERVEVPGADHTFSSSAWRSIVEVRTIDWIKRYFPVQAK